MSRFTITYHITLPPGEEIDPTIENICLEQSVELPARLLSPSIKENIIGQPVEKKQTGEQQFKVTIAWPADNIGGEITQFLNILYGNISLYPGIRIAAAEWSEINKATGSLFKGPAYGIDSLRNRYGIQDRPLSSTALKPMGTDVSGLAHLCYEFATAGIDIIKDDHGLADQTYAPFKARVKACVEAVEKAAQQSGSRSCYYPNITADGDEAAIRYREAAELGADGVLLCPHLTGLELMHRLARMDHELPIIAHPALSGSLVTNRESGMTPDFLYGQLWRALGADFVVYPNTGGRFSFSPEECRRINRAARSKALPFRRSFPMPGGGMSSDSIPQWMETYGNDTVFLLGSSLYSHVDGPRAGAEELSVMVKGKT